MPFLSQLLNRPVIGASGRKIGRVVDIPAAHDAAYPPVLALALRPEHGHEVRLVPWSQVATVGPHQFQLNVDDIDTSCRSTLDDELWLRRDVLDKQIVDVEGAKLVRVNDIQLARIDRELRVAAVDNTARGFLRRLGLEPVTALLSHHGATPALIDWEEIDLVPGRDDAVTLKVPYTRLRRLHPAQIAEVIGQLTPSAGAFALETMDDETAAQALAELAPEHATAVLHAMDEEEAADILEEMDADDAADLLGELDEEMAADLISRMETEAADDVRQLLTYPEDTAGGLMNPEFVSVPETLRAAEVIDLLRRTVPEDIFYLYVVDASNRLVGSLSLRDLVVAPADERVGSLMEREPISVPVTADEAEVARLLLKFNLVSVPVIDEERQLIGVVAVDDVLDVLAPRSWHQHARRMLA